MLLVHAQARAGLDPLGDGELAAGASCPILTSIQVKEYYRPDERFIEQQFEACLAAALAPPSAGVVLWSWDAIAQPNYR